MPSIQPIADLGSRLVDDLHEDLETRWIPDVIADSDLRGQLLRPLLRRDDVQLVDVPRVGGGYRQAPVMSGAAMGLLRRAVMPLREVSEEVLDPAVCGYRQGAAGDTTYSDEYRRFRQMSLSLADDYAFVVTADVSNFFESVNIAHISSAMVRKYGSAWEGVEQGLRILQQMGVRGLPAGYGDARLIGNLILAHVDSRLSVPFTRWVDDYRLFVNSEGDANQLLSELETALRELGLGLNGAKTQIMPSGDFLRRRMGIPLDSVYHPQDEPREIVRANLRNVFSNAVASENRRLLRFVLPRLGAEGDDFALAYALVALQSDHVDAPRMVQYVAAFLGDPGVNDRVQDLVVDLGVRGQVWNLLRVTPLLCRIPLRSNTVAALALILRDTRSAAVWGAILRVLSVQHEQVLVREALSERPDIPDSRAAVAAQLDLGLPVSEGLRERAAATLRALEDLAFIPLPSVDSRL